MIKVDHAPVAIMIHHDLQSKVFGCHQVDDCDIASQLSNETGNPKDYDYTSSD